MIHLYMIINTVNEKRYIGITTQSLMQRWREHIYRFRSGTRDHKLYQAMRKYGVENFTFYKLESFPSQYSVEYVKGVEVCAIKHYDSFNNGYNMTEGGDMISDETRRKISEAHKGKPHDWNGWDSGVRRANSAYHKKPSEYVAKGADNSSAKEYTVQFPDGRVETVKGMAAFCRKHGLSFNLMLAVLYGKQTHHKGFVCLARSNDYYHGKYGQATGNSAHPDFSLDNVPDLDFEVEEQAAG